LNDRILPVLLTVLLWAMVALLGAFGWSTFAAAIVPVVVLGLNWKRATPAAAVVAIVISLTINFSVEIFSISLPYGVSGGYLAFVVSMALFMTVSLCGRARPLAQDMAARAGHRPGDGYVALHAGVILRSFSGQAALFLDSDESAYVNASPMVVVGGDIVV
tara:strand:+ start:2879 stop:3361 length:483 start_codon:yes stop_codon:yes gene_type:complete